MQKSLVSLFRFLLATNQIAMLKSKESVFKGSLRVVVARTGQHAGQQQQAKDAIPQPGTSPECSYDVSRSFRSFVTRYGLVWPLAVVVPAVTLPCPMHPSFILSIFSVK